MGDFSHCLHVGNTKEKKKPQRLLKLLRVPKSNSKSVNKQASMSGRGKEVIFEIMIPVKAAVPAG